jgi:hypothetical protein
MSQELVRTNTIAIDVYKSPTAAILSVCGRAVGVLQGLAITKDNIIPLVRAIMEAVETVQLVEKVDKKALALDSIHWIVNQQSSMADSDRSFLNNFIELTAPSMIDMIVAASKGLTEINKKVGSCCGCF